MPVRDHPSRPKKWHGQERGGDAGAVGRGAVAGGSPIPSAAQPSRLCRRLRERNASRDCPSPGPSHTPLRPARPLPPSRAPAPPSLSSRGSLGSAPKGRANRRVPSGHLCSHRASAAGGSCWTGGGIAEPHNRCEGEQWGIPGIVETRARPWLAEANGLVPLAGGWAQDQTVVLYI